MMSRKGPDSVDRIVGRNIRIWRMAKGLSQVQLAERLDVTFQQLQKYESGTNRASTERLAIMAAVLAIPISTLFEGANARAPSGSLLALVSDSRSFRLALAFAAIKDKRCRGSLVKMVENIAAAVPETKRQGR